MVAPISSLPFPQAATWGLAMTMLRGRCPKTMVFPVQFPDQQHQVTWKFVKNANLYRWAICFDKPPGNFDAGQSGRIPSTRRGRDRRNSQEQGRAAHLSILTCSEENLNLLLLKPHLFLTALNLLSSLIQVSLESMLGYRMKEGLPNGDDFFLHKEVTYEFILVELQRTVDCVTLPC